MYRYILFLIISINCAFAAAPNGISYQGYLQNTDGSPVSGAVELKIAIWNSPNSINVIDKLYVESHAVVPVLDGVFSIELGSGTIELGSFDPDLFSESDRWLEIIVDGDPLTPRTKFLSVPYALQAQQADSLTGMSGAVMHFALPKCPAGWSEFTDARGRTLVGMPASGTLEGTSGNALTDLENRQHNHTVPIAPVATNTVLSHAHSRSSLTTSTDTHNHRWSKWNGAPKNWTSFNSSGVEFTITNWTDGMDQAGSGIYPIAASTSGTTTIYTDRDAHSHSTGSGTTGSGGGHLHTVPGGPVVSAAAVRDPTLPYVQLLVCVKD